jgi:hypothetical protein
MYCQLLRPSSCLALALLVVSPSATAQGLIAVEQIGDLGAISIVQLGLDNTIIVANGSSSGRSDNFTADLGQTGNSNLLLLVNGAGAADVSLSAQQTGALNVINFSNAGAAAINLTAFQSGDGKSLSVNLQSAAAGSAIQVSQTGAGAHLGEISLLSASHNVLLSQDGSAAHEARLTIAGEPRAVEVRQNGSVSRSILILDSCSLQCGTPIIVDQR